MSDTEHGPLDGIKVVELTMYVQGPVAGLALASLGAEVVKIEQVGRGDSMREFSGAFGLTFDERDKRWVYASLNRNKRSLALDIVSESGRAVFEKLVAECDVFLTNLRLDGLRRFGADPETLLAINPRLVYCRGAGFGVRGPRADEPCQDTVGMAHAGFMDAVSPSDVPTYPPGSMSDVLTGTNMASAVMAGLVKRERTGSGSVIETSQTQSLLWLQLQAAGAAVNLGRRMERFDPVATTNPLFTVYRTTDGWIAVAVLIPTHYPVVVDAVGLGGILDDPRFASLAAVQENRDLFRPLFAARMSERSTVEWWSILKQAGVWASPVNRLEDLATDEDILANGYLVEFDDGFVGPPVPFDVDGFGGVRGSVADYGEHTDQVLGELGYSETQILELRIDGAIW